jgi:hypothetical protein
VQNTLREMTSSFRNAFPKEKETKRITNARIVEIQSINNVVLATLASSLLVTRDGSRPLYRGLNADKSMTFDEARQRWFTATGKVSIGEQDDPSMLAAFLSTSGVDAEHDELVFNTEQEESMERNVKSMRVRADCVVEYDLNEQGSGGMTATGNIMQSLAGGGVAATATDGDSFAYDEYDLLDEPDPKRTKIEETPLKPKPVMQRSVITGTWSCLAICVALDITVKISQSNSGSKNEVVEMVPHFDRTATDERIKLGDFAMAIRQGACIHPLHVETIMHHIFPTLFNKPLGLKGVCTNTLRPPEPVARDEKDPPVALPSPYDYTVSADELRAAIDVCGVASIERLFNRHSVFAGVMPMVLYPRAVATFADIYGAKRLPEILARGALLITHLWHLITCRPHVLCFSELKYNECVSRQKSYIDDARKWVKLLSSQRPEAETNMERCEAKAAAIRWLSAMPEMSMRSYVEVTRRHADTIHMRAEQRQTVYVAIDIYNSIIRHDLFAGGPGQFDEDRRHETVGRGATSGHVFSVFGNCNNTQVPGDKYDSGYSDGTLSLDTFFAAYEHEQREKKIAAQASAAKPVSAPTKPSAKRKIVDEIDDFLPVKLPPTPPAVVQTSSAVTPQLIKKPAVVEPPESLTEDIRRLNRPCTSYEFCCALRWMVEQSLLIVFCGIGTGPRNLGRRFDMFYTPEMWRTQQVICGTLGDIYKRALLERLSPPAKLKCSVADLNASLAFREHARTILRNLIKRERQRREKMYVAKQALRAGADDIKSRDQYRNAAGDRINLIQITELHRCVADFIGADAPPNQIYADMLRSETHGLVCDTNEQIEARLAASKMSDEQKAGMRHVMQNGITIFMSPGGCGKSFTVECVTKCFPIDQIVVCALTGKACEVLMKQIGKVSTIHSLLVRETLHRQAVQKHRETMARLELALKSVYADPDTSPDQLEFMKLQLELERLVGIGESRSPMENVRVLIVDETSLCDEVLCRRLLEVLHPLNCKQPGNSALMRVLILGDFNQLGSIEPGALLHVLCRAFPHCVRTFTKNFRSAGRGIFEMARGIVLRKKFEPNFNMQLNEKRLRSPTTPVDDTPEARAAAEDASCVFYSTSDRTLAADLRRVLGLLGAVTPKPVSDELLSLRDGIHIIAPTNALSNTCNNLCREMYFGRLASTIDGEQRHELPLPILYFKVRRADRIYFKRNFKIAIEVSRHEYIEQKLDEESKKQVATKAVRRQVELSAMAAVDAADVDAAADENDAPQSVATENGANAIAWLDKQMQTVGYSVSSGEATRVTVRFYNSEILTTCDFYDTARNRRENAPKPICICGACIIERGSDGRVLSDVPRTCVRWPHVPPASRCKIGDMSPTARLFYHDQNMTPRDSIRRVIFRTQTGQFKQLDVDTDMSDRTAWEYAWATTVHRYQGSGTRTVIVVIPHDTSFVDRCMLYTALTRAEQRVVFMGSADTWRRVSQREPPMRRTELWFMLAQAIAKSHADVAKQLDLESKDGGELAKALYVTSPTECEMLNTNRAPLPADSVATWKLFDKIYEEKLRAAGLREL